MLHALFAESGRPFLLQAGDDCEGGADLRPAAFRQADECGPAVRRVGAPFEVAALLEVIDEVAHRLFGDLRALREGGEA